MNRNNVLELRTASDFTPQQKAAVDLITIQKDILPVGSIRYEAQKYPADIDIFEQYKLCCSINQVSLNVAQQIQQIAQRVKDRNDVYFADFKAGFDNRYDVNLGEVTNNQIIDYNPALIRRDIENLLAQGLLTQTQYNNLIQMVKDNPSLQEFNALYEAFRELNYCIVFVLIILVPVNFLYLFLLKLDYNLLFDYLLLLPNSRHIYYQILL